MNFWNRLEAVAEQHSVLRHSFYVRWSEGTLGVAELAYYSGQYRHAVIALADASTAAARSSEAGADAPVLAEHAAEEAAHVGLWDEVAADASEETRACATVWAGDESRPLLHTLTAMYTIESAQPAISRTKQDGLALHYGIPAVAYFDVHQDLDVEHAAQARRHRPALGGRRRGRARGHGGGCAQGEPAASGRRGTRQPAVAGALWAGHNPLRRQIGWLSQAIFTG